MNKVRALCVLLVALGSTPVIPEETAPALPAEDAEQLLAQPPPGWQLLYQFRNDQIRIAEFIPPGQGIETWDRKVSFESYSEQPDADPIDMLLGEAERMAEECKIRQHFNLFSGFENGYQTSTRMVMCTEHKTTGGGAVRMLKAIKGERYFYLIALTRKVSPFEPNQPEMSKEEVAGWASYLRMITVCEQGSATHPCPAPGAEESHTP